MLLDKNYKVSTQYRVIAIPTTCFVNKEVTIVDCITGYVEIKYLKINSNNFLLNKRIAKHNVMIY